MGVAVELTTVQICIDLKVASVAAEVAQYITEHQFVQAVPLYLQAVAAH